MAKEERAQRRQMAKEEREKFIRVTRQKRVIDSESLEGMLFVVCSCIVCLCLCKGLFSVKLYKALKHVNKQVECTCKTVWVNFILVYFFEPHG